MRRKDREITDRSAILAILNSLHTGHLAMTDGVRPYGVTMNFLPEGQGDSVTLYFHGAASGRKAEILGKNPAVYFFAERDDGACEKEYPDGSRSVTDRYVSVAGEGTMELVDDPGEKCRILAALAGRYMGHPWMFPVPEGVVRKTAVWKLTLKNITGKSNPPMKKN